LPIWERIVAGIKASLGLNLEIGGEAKAGTKYEITVDTTEKSYLYYTAPMTDPQTNAISTISIEKNFECNQSPNIGPGDRINKVKFTIEKPGSFDDPIKYELRNSDEYLKIPERVCSLCPRPLFVSINSTEQHSKVLQNIIKIWKVDVNLAHFMLSNLNYSCPSIKRKLCGDLIAEYNK